jgi:hypothetical protein
MTVKINSSFRPSIRPVNLARRGFDRDVDSAVESVGERNEWSSFKSLAVLAVVANVMDITDGRAVPALNRRVSSQEWVEIIASAL